MSQSRQTAPIALSLFAGAGGMDLGVSQAGYQILASIENDPNCCDTLRAWKEIKGHSTRIVEADIRKVDPGELMHELGLQPGQLDLLFGGPPCQAFSQIGKRGCLEDERGMLLFQMARFAKVFQPRAILTEQVKGLLNAPDHEGMVGGVFQMFLKELDSIGYVPRWQVINAADYGVPQRRHRVFIVAMRPPSEFSFPPPTHGQTPAYPTLFPATEEYPTAGQALRGLRRPRSRHSDSESNDSHVDVTPDGDRWRISGVPEGSHLAREHHLPANQRQNLSKKDTTKFRRIARSEPSLTLRCGEIFFHPTQDRYLTPREYMRLHGFPDDYILKGPIRSRSGRVRNLDQHRQVANSVPPPVAKRLAEAILRTKACPKSSRFSATLSATPAPPL